MQPLRILQVHNRYREPGGEDTVVAREAELLRGAGHTVIEHHVENSSNSVTAAATLLAAPWNPAAAGRIRRSVEEHRPNVAHIHNTWWSFTPSVVWALDRLDVPIVMTLHNYRLMCVNGMLFRDGAPCEDCVGTHPWHGVRHGCYRGSAAASAVTAATIQLNRWLRTWQRADRMLALTRFARERFVAAGLPAEQIHVKSNFVDDPGSRPAAPSNSRTVLFVGRLSREKGVAELLDAWAARPQADLELALVGDGPLRSALESRRVPNVQFLGRLASADVQRLMLTSRGLVFPSVWYEGQPMVLLEALAAGLPVAVSDIGGIPETVGGADSAVLARPGDTGAWAAVFDRLTDDDRVDALGEAGRRVFEVRYAPEVGLENLVEVYEAVIAGRSGRG